MNIDWNKAPEDATHAGATTGLNIPVFYKDIREDKYSYWYDVGDGWREDVTGNPSCTPLIERPKKQYAWDGEGLPPVGTVCDMHIDDFGWITGTVVVHIDLDEPTAVAHNGEEVFHGNASDFRPIKTAEQLEEEEREKEAIELYLTMQPASNSKAWDNIGDYARDRYRLAISSGYRKQ